MIAPRLLWLCHVFTLFILFSSSAFAQVSGCIEDSTGAVIPGATVILTAVDSNSRFQAQSDEAGCYSIPGVQAGRYELVLLAEGFASYERRIAVEDGASLEKAVLEIRPMRDTVVVTATRTPASSMALGSSVDVIERGQIEASKLPVISDLLRQRASINVLRTGNTGGMTSLFVRGGESDYTKILIDGIPVNQPGGLYDFSHIPSDNIGRIEIVRGPQSALFGSDAITGVVQLFTRPGTPSPEFDYSVEGGSFDTLQQRAGMRAAWRKLDFSSTFSRLDTDNIGRNNDYRNASYFGNFGFTPDSRQSLRGTLVYGRSKAGAPGANAPGFMSWGPDDRTHRLERAAGLTYRLLAGPRLTQHLAYRLHDYDYTYFSDFGAWDNLHTRHRAEYRGDIALPHAGLFSYGVDFDRENAAVAGRRRSRDNFGYYVQQQLAIVDRIDVTAGVRIEDNTTFGTSANPRIGVSLHILPVTRLRFAAGTGTKEPNFTENFSEDRFFRGNPNLLEERSRSWEVGLEQSFWGDRITSDLAWFDNRFRNVIELVSQPDGSGRYENIGRSRARGLELRTRVRARAFSGHVNYTFLEGHIQQSTQRSFPFRPGDPLLRRAKHAADFSVTWSQPRWSAYWSTRYVGRRADSDFFTFSKPLTSNPWYMSSNATFTIEATRNLSAYVRMENVFDRDYQEVLGYQALGQGVAIGMQVRFRVER